MSRIAALPLAIVRAFGRTGMGFSRHLGGIGLLTFRVARVTLTGQVSFRMVAAQAYEMGKKV